MQDLFYIIIEICIIENLKKKMIKKLMFFLNIQRVEKFHQETFVEKISDKQKKNRWIWAYNIFSIQNLLCSLVA